MKFRDIILPPKKSLLGGRSLQRSRTFGVGPFSAECFWFVEDSHHLILKACILKQTEFVFVDVEQQKFADVLQQGWSQHSFPSIYLPVRLERTGLLGSHSQNWRVKTSVTFSPQSDMKVRFDQLCTVPCSSEADISDIYSWIITVEHKRDRQTSLHRVALVTTCKYPTDIKWIINVWMSASSHTRKQPEASIRWMISAR